MSNGLVCVQVVLESKSAEEANRELKALQELGGYLGGRVLGEGGGKPWRAQAFFPAVEGLKAGDEISNEMRVVFIPSSLAPSLGISLS